MNILAFWQQVKNAALAAAGYTDSVAITTLNSAKAYTDAVVVSAVKIKSYQYDASTGAFPLTGGSGPSGAILAQDAWIVSVQGDIAGRTYYSGDAIVALVDSPGQTASNWDPLNSSAIASRIKNDSSVSGSTVKDALQTLAAADTGGTVTSVSGSGGTTGLTLGGGPITNTGTLTIDGTLVVANGGTGATTAADARTNLSAAVLGANGDITALSGLTGSISTPTNIDFVNNGANPAYLNGRVFFDSTAEALAYYNDVNGNPQHLGREIWVKVRNQTGSTINLGKAVYLSGATGQIPLVSLAKADALATTLMLGVVASGNIANNSFGYAAIFGEVTGIDTSAFSDGNPVYLSATTAGALTATAPTAPNYQVLAGFIEYAHATQGKLLVRSLPRYVELNTIPGGTSAQIPVVGSGGAMAFQTVSGDATLANTGALTLANTAVSDGSYGSATQVGTFTVDAKGRLTAAGNTTVTPAWSNITSTPTTIAGYGITDVKTAAGLSSVQTTETMTLVAGATTAFATSISGAKKITLEYFGTNTTAGAGPIAQIKANGSYITTGIYKYRAQNDTTGVFVGGNSTTQTGFILDYNNSNGSQIFSKLELGLGSAIVQGIFQVCEDAGSGAPKYTTGSQQVSVSAQPSNIQLVIPTTYSGYCTLTVDW